MSQFLKASIRILGLVTLLNGLMMAAAFAAKDFNIKNNTQSFLFVNGASGNIGLGTTTPQGGFTITNGNVGIGTWAPTGVFQVNGLSNTPFVVNSTGNVGVGTSILGGGFIVMNGNVGIGTWAPTAALTITNGAVASGLNPVVMLHNKSSSGGANLDLGFAISASTPIGSHSILRVNRTNKVSSGDMDWVFMPSTAFVATEYMRLTGDAGNLGIGTSLPLSKLSIVGNIGVGTGKSSSFILNSAPTGGIIVEGNVGIGTLTPGTALDVSGTVRATAFSGDGSALTGISNTSGFTDSGTVVHSTTMTDNVGLGTSDASLGKLIVTGGNVGIGTTLANQAALSVINGNIGLGTWVPYSMVDIQGNQQNTLNIGSANNGGTIVFSRTGTSGAARSMITQTFNELGIYFQGASGKMNFYTNSGNRMSISSVGNIGMGTIDPMSKLTVNGAVGIGTANSVFVQSTAPAGGMIIEGNVGIGTVAPDNALIVRTGNVGIGSNSPTHAKLEIIGDAATELIRINDVGPDDTTPFIIDRNGNLGIGTIRPVAKIDLIGAAAAQMRMADVVTNATNKNSYISLRHYTNAQSDVAILVGTSSSSASTVRYGGGSSGLNAATQLQFYTASDNTTLTGTQRMTIDSAGNVGIGTTTPQSGLVVLNGNVGLGTWTTTARLDTDGIRLSTNPASGYVLVSNSTGIGTWMAPGTLTASSPSQWFTTAGVGIGTYENVGLGTSTPQGAFVVTNGNMGVGTWSPSNKFQVNSATQASFVVTDSGNVGINTSSPASALAVMGGNVGIGTWVANTKFVVRKDASSGVNPAALFINGLSSTGANVDLGFVITSSSPTTGNAYLRVQRTNLVNSGDMDFVFMPATAFVATERMRLTAAGNLAIGTYVPGSLLSVAGGVGIGTGFNSTYVSAAAPVGGMIIEDNVGIGTTTPQARLVVLGNVGLGTWTADTARLATDGFRLTTNPASGYVLVSGSTGIGTWMSPSSIGAGGASGWSTGTGTVYTTTGSDNVGIGTSTPQSGFVVTNGNVGIGTWVASRNLYVVGDAAINTNVTNYTSTTSAFDVNGAYMSIGDKVSSKTFTSDRLGIKFFDSGKAHASMIYDSTNDRFDFCYSSSNNGLDCNGASNSSLTIMVTNDEGHVAVSRGSNTPHNTVNLEVFKTNTEDNFAINSGSVLGDLFIIKNAGNVGVGTNVPGSLLSVAGGVGIGTGFNSAYVSAAAPVGGMIIQDNVGIGTTTPQDKLIVLGNVGLGTWTATARLDTDGIRLSTNPAAGYVLVSGSTGIGTWMAASTLATTGGAASGWSTGTGTVYATTGSDKVGIGTSTPQGGLVVTNGNVGIGTWAPTALLDVQGAGDSYFTTNVGIGSSVPTQSLDVFGTGKFSTGVNAPKITNLTSNGFVKTGSGDGTLSVDTNTYPSYSSMTQNYIQKATSTTAVGNSLIFDNGTNIGIGTNTPQGAFVVTNGNVGIGTWTVQSLLQVKGSMGVQVVSKTADYTATGSDYVILVDASGGAVTITLPAASGVAGRVYHVKKTDSSGNSVTIDPNAAETVDGAGTISTTTQYQSFTIICDGSNWWVI